MTSDSVLLRWAVIINDPVDTATLPFCSLTTGPIQGFVLNHWPTVLFLRKGLAQKLDNRRAQ